MSNPPPNPYAQPPQPPPNPPVWDYLPPPQDNAPQLIRLAVIFNYISVGLDAVLAVLVLGISIFFFFAPEFVPRDPGDPPAWVLSLIYLGVGVMALILAIAKLIATRKLQRGGPQAWGWGLAAGIIGCVQLFCLSCICLQAAAGIYTIIILCFQNVRHHLATQTTPDS